MQVKTAARFEPPISICSENTNAVLIAPTADECMTNVFQDAKNGAEIKAVDAYCWLHATVHLDSNLLRKLNTIPRIRSPCRGFPEVNNDVDGADTLYYQWVPFFLLLQVGIK